MSAITNPIGYPQPGNTWLDGIVWGLRWYTPTSPTQTIISYAPTTQPGWEPEAGEMAAYRQILANIQAICNVTFVQTNAIDADIVFASINAATAVSLGYDATVRGFADPPGTNFETAVNDYQSWVFMNYQQYSGGDGSFDSLYKGGFDYMVSMHEIGHALGLAHPHDTGGASSIFPGVTAPFGSYGTGDLNQGIYTTMSYNAGWLYFDDYMPTQYGWQATMMAFDIAALQYLYGANMTTATGDDGYLLTDKGFVGAAYQCIWDAGGTDVILYTGTYGCLIELRAATLDPLGGYGAGGFISYVFGGPLVYGGMTIANGVTIENASGGSGGDILVGNDVNNLLYGNAGNDLMYGIGGDDLLWGGEGADTLIGGAGADSIVGSYGTDYLVGESGADLFYLYEGFQAGDFDYCADIQVGEDYLLVPGLYQGAIYFFEYAGAAWGYANVGGGSYYFGAAGLTAAQLQASVSYLP